MQTQGGRPLPISGMSASRSGCAPEEKTSGLGHLLTQLAGAGREVWSGEGRAREDPCPAHLEAAKSDSVRVGCREWIPPANPTRPGRSAFSPAGTTPGHQKRHTFVH